MDRRPAAWLLVMVTSLAACGADVGRPATSKTTDGSRPPVESSATTTTSSSTPTTSMPTTSPSTTFAAPATAVVPVSTDASTVPSTPLLFARSFDDASVFSVPAPSEAATMSMLTVVGDTIVGLAGRCDSPGGVEVVAFDRRTGRRRWTTPLDGSAETWDWRVTTSDNVAVFETTDATGGTLYGIDVRDGTQRWRRETPRGANLSVTVPVIIALDGPDEYVALDPVTGTEKWRRHTTGATPTAVDGADIVIEQESGRPQPDQTVTALDATTGTELWTRPAADEFAGDRDTVVFNLPDDAGVVAIDRTTGAERWRIDGRSVLFSCETQTIGDGRVPLYRQGTAETVIASLATGQTLWTVDTTVTTDATILGDVVVHLGRDENGQPNLELLDASSGAHLGVVHPPPLEDGQVSVPFIINDGTFYGGRGCTGRG